MTYLTAVIALISAYFINSILLSGAAAISFVMGTKGVLRGDGGARDASRIDLGFGDKFRLKTTTQTVGSLVIVSSICMGAVGISSLPTFKQVKDEIVVAQNPPAPEIEKVRLQLEQQKEENRRAIAALRVETASKLNTLVTAALNEVEAGVTQNVAKRLVDLRQLESEVETTKRLTVLLAQFAKARANETSEDGDPAKAAQIRDKFTKQINTILASIEVGTAGSQPPSLVAPNERVELTTSSRQQAFRNALRSRVASHCSPGRPVKSAAGTRVPGYQCWPGFGRWVVNMMQDFFSPEISLNTASDEDAVAKIYRGLTNCLKRVSPYRTEQESQCVSLALAQLKKIGVL